MLCVYIHGSTGSEQCKQVSRRVAISSNLLSCNKISDTVLQDTLLWDIFLCYILL